MCAHVLAIEKERVVLIVSKILNKIQKKKERKKE